jgi:ATP-binding cassette subfamily C exporter for protease/lipase
MKNPSFFERSELTQTLWAFRREFLVVGIFSMVANVLMLAPTLYMLQVFDRVLSSQSELTLLAMSLITLFLLGVMAFSEWMRSRVLVQAGVRLDGVLNTRVFNASFEAELSPSGKRATGAFSDLIQIRQFITGNGALAFFDTPWTPVYIAVLFVLHPFLGYVGIFFAILQGLLAWFGHHRAVAPSETANKVMGETGQFLQNKLRNTEVLEPMGMVNNLRPRWAERHARAQALNGQAQALTHRLTAVSKFLRYTQQSLALGAGALLVIDGQLTPGAMIAANVLMTRALAPIDMLVGAWRGFIGARGAFERLEALLRAHPQRDPALSRVAPQGAMVLRDLVASAPGRAEPILKGISVAVAPGTVTVVLGPSGSGKSTLARCLVGIWPGAAGEVLLDGLPIGGWDRHELGPYLGYLPQDIELFEGSIAENIARFGEVDSEQVIAAARSAGLHEMILRFPKGYDTPIGEAGSLLSGGQRQRIGLARAVYGDPVLVVLDEPNANLDDVGEAALVQTVRELKAKGRTVFLITHRPGIVAVADRLLLLRDGRVQAEGPRDGVLAGLRAAQAQPAAPAPGTGLNPQPA